MSLTSRGAARTAALVTLLASSLVHAQDYDRVAPKVPQPNAPPSVTEPPPATVPDQSGDDTVLVPVLKGIVFQPSVNALTPDGVPADDQHAIQAPGNPLLL